MTLVAVASDLDPPPTIDLTVARPAGDRDAFACRTTSTSIACTRG
jgi:hypothetical protein